MKLVVPVRPLTQPAGFLDVDLGIANIATTSDGVRHCGKGLNRIRHSIAKRIVTEAGRTGRGIALEDLGGIRDRVRLRGPQRVTLHSWAFAQLGQFVADKAARAGVAVLHVDPRYTSQGCSACGYVARANRPHQHLPVHVVWLC